MTDIRIVAGMSKKNTLEITISRMHEETGGSFLMLVLEIKEMHTIISFLDSLGQPTVFLPLICLHP